MLRAGILKWSEERIGTLRWMGLLKNKELQRGWLIMNLYATEEAGDLAWKKVHNIISQSRRGPRDKKSK